MTQPNNTPHAMTTPTETGATLRLITPTPTRSDKTRTARLLSYLDMMIAEEASADLRELVRDLRALRSLVAAIDTEAQGAADVPSWGNHTCERTGKLDELGNVAATYAAWIEEGNEPVNEHDGACQLGEMAKRLRRTLNALDRVAFRGNR